MTYQELLNQLMLLTEEELKENVTVLDYSQGEFLPVVDEMVRENDEILGENCDSGVLDEGHWVMVINRAGSWEDESHSDDESFFYDQTDDDLEEDEEETVVEIEDESEDLDSSAMQE